MDPNAPNQNHSITDAELQAEWDRIQSEGLVGAHYTLAPMNGDLHSWKATIYPPEESYYAGGTFELFIYPQNPVPTATFNTPIYHPNVAADGYVAIGKWQEGMTVEQVVVNIVALLDDPDTEACQIVAIGQQYEDDRPAFAAKAREWVDDYAVPLEDPEEERAANEREEALNRWEEAKDAAAKQR